MNEVVIVEADQATEQQLVETARSAVDASAWVVGECAARWTERFARGRTDADFGELIGLTRDQVCQRRQVWERFGKCDPGHTLSWSHYREALNWEDAAECLQWAADFEATKAEMRAWRRAKRGEPLTDTPEISERDAERAASVPEKQEQPIAQPSTRKVTAETQRKPRTTGAAGNAQPQSTPVEAAESQASNDPALPPTITPAEDAETRILFALREIGQMIDQIQERKKVAARFRKFADQLDPPTKFRPPSVDDVAEYCRERGNKVDPEAFVAYYSANGWKLSNGNKMADWEAAVRTWESRDRKQGKADGRTRERNWEEYA